MSVEIWEHDGEYYSLLPTYVKGDEAWYFELSEALPTPDSWQGPRLPGTPSLTAAAHDPDVDKPPYVFAGNGESIPFEVLTRFVNRVAELLSENRA